MKFHGLTFPRIERPLSVIPLAEWVATLASIDDVSRNGETISHVTFCDKILQLREF